MESRRHCPLPKSHVLSHLNSFYWLHVVDAVWTHTGVLYHTSRRVELQIISINFHVNAYIFKSGFSQRSNTEMWLLEVIYILILEQFLQFLHFLTLIWSQSFDIYFFEDLFLDIFNISANGCAVDFLAFTFEGMTEIEDKIFVIEFLFIVILIKCSDVFVCDSAILLIMQEDFLTEIDVDFIGVKSSA